MVKIESIILGIYGQTLLCDLLLPVWVLNYLLRNLGDTFNHRPHLFSANVPQRNPVIFYFFSNIDRVLARLLEGQQ